MAVTLDDAVSSLYSSPRLDDHRAAARVLQRRLQLRLGPPEAEVRPTVRVARDEGLPTLAWSCRVDAGCYEFLVGPGVEVGDGFVFEGVWDQPFDARGFHGTDFAYGSGARFGKYVIFVPPKHCWEQLYVLHRKREGDTLVSNSLGFLLAEAAIDTAGQFVARLATCLRTGNDEATAVGFDRYEPVILEDEDAVLYRMMFHNFTVDGAGRFRLLPSAPELHFSTFDEYESFLSGAVGRIAANGVDPGRSRRMTPITPISNGYDSPAVGAIAARLGLTDAVTLDVTVKGRDDSGAAVGAMLGLDVATARHFLGNSLPELAFSASEEQRDEIAEFVATAGLGDDLMLTTLEPHLRERVLLSGAMGDSAWKRATTLPPGLPVRVVYGKSFTEFRLRVGYAFVPVPAIGARFPAAVRRVTRSPEMAPWTLNQPYDRPIPRRLVESAGVPRGSFARAKAATNPTVLNYESLFLPSLSTLVERYRKRAF